MKQKIDGAELTKKGTNILQTKYNNPDNMKLKIK